MIGKEAKQAGSASLNEVLGILEERKKERELTYEQQIALEHAGKFVPVKASEQKARKALEALGTLTQQSLTCIINTMPRGEALLKQILAGEKRAFSDDEIKQMLSIINPK